MRTCALQHDVVVPTLHSCHRRRYIAVHLPDIPQRNPCCFLDIFLVGISIRFENPKALKPKTLVEHRDLTFRTGAGFEFNFVVHQPQREWDGGGGHGVVVGGARRTPPPGKKGRMEWMGHQKEGERTRHVEESEGHRQRRRAQARLSSTASAWRVEPSNVSIHMPCMRCSSVLGYTVLDMGRHRSTHSHTLLWACRRFGDVQRNRTCVLVDAPNYCLVHPIGFQLLPLRSHSFVLSFPL